MYLREICHNESLPSFRLPFILLSVRTKSCNVISQCKIKLLTRMSINQGCKEFLTYPLVGFLDDFGSFPRGE